MKNKFEHALFIRSIRDVDEDSDRIYFGNEFCENLIPSAADLKKMFFYARSKRKEFTFVTPFVTESGFKKLDRLLKFLNDQHAIEVVFNDWGTLKLMNDKFKNLQPVLGRLLTKQRRDPRMLKIFSGDPKRTVIIDANKKIKTILVAKEIPRTLFEHYQASVVNLPVFHDYLLARGINRVEIDNLAWEMNIKVNKKIGVSIYLPYGYITTSRMCGKLTLSYAACKKECKKYFFQLKDRSLPVPFYGIGNTIFYKSAAPSNGYLEKLGIDRIVYQPRLPF